MVKNHMKRLTAPGTWKILRKEEKFVTKPSPGGHESRLAVSLNTFLKELSGLASTTKETKYLLTNKEVLVNGRRKRDFKHQAGFLDLVSIPSEDKHYMVVLDGKGRLRAKEIKKADADKTLLRITGKKMLGKDKMQVSTLSGANILVKPGEAKNYKTGDTLLVSMPDCKISKHITFEKGVNGVIFTGKHSGKHGTLQEIKEDVVSIKTGRGTLETKKEYFFVTGKDKPEIDLAV